MCLRNFLAACAACLLTAPVVAELPDGLIWDDGGAWFDVKGDSIMEDSKPKDLGWVLQYKVRIFGATPQRSAFKLVISKDGKELGSLREQGKNPVIGQPGFDYDRHWQMLFQESLSSWKQRIVGAGLYDLDIYYIDGATEKEYLARAYKLDVRAAHRVRGPTTNAVKDAPDYYLNRHGDTAWAMIYRRPAKYPSYDHTGGRPGTSGTNQVEVYWNTVPRESELEGKSVSVQTWIGGRLRVKVDGKPLDLGSDPLRQQVGNDLAQDVHSVPMGNHMEPFKEKIRFAMYRTTLPLTWRDDTEELLTKQASGSVTYEAQPMDNRVMLNDHPGRWEAEWIVNGELIRTWIFDVTEDGKIKPWKEAPDNVTLHPFASLVEMNIPEGGTSIDGRLTPEFVREGAFFGLGLPKAFEKKVPEKGEPFLPDSGPEVVAVDPQAERRAQYEAEKAAREAAADAKVAERKAAAEARKAEIEAERGARDAQRAAATEAAKEAAADAFEQAKREAVASSEQALAAAAAARANAEQQMKDLQRKSGSGGGAHLLMRLLLSVALIGLGLILAGNMLKGMAEPLAGTIDALTEQANVIGLVAIALALVDFLLDLVALRPIVGDGLPQLAALLGGFICAKETLSKQAAVQKHQAKLAGLEGHSQNIGLACLVLGVLHLVIGAVALL